MTKTTGVAAGLLLAFGIATAQPVGLAHINIQTRDIERSTRFYTENLNFRKVLSQEINEGNNRIRKFAFLQNGSCILEIMQPGDTGQVKTKTAGTIPHFALETLQLENTVQELRKKGVVFKTPVFERQDFLGGIKGGFVYGPDGEEIELIEYTGTKPF